VARVVDAALPIGRVSHVDLRTPDTGGLIGYLLSSAGRTGLEEFSRSETIGGATEADLLGALDFMAEGNIEYVILEEGERFLQAAGDGDGPYQLEYCPGGADRAGVRDALSSFLRGDTAWQTDREWAPLRF
jgi:hypothetical protein